MDNKKCLPPWSLHASGGKHSKQCQVVVSAIKKKKEAQRLLWEWVQFEIV